MNGQSNRHCYCQPHRAKKVPTLLLGLTCSGRAIMFGPFSFVTIFSKYGESRDAPIQVTVVLEFPIMNVFVVL